MTAQTTLITGANRGIGLELVRQHLQEGWQVFATCRTPESASELNALAAQHPENCTVLALDIADENTYAPCDTALGDFSIDLLWNNAGVYGPRDAALGELPEAEWLETLRVNVIAPIRFTQFIGKRVANSSGKAIAFLSSKMGSLAENSSGGAHIYRSSKAGLNAAARSLALELQPHGIRTAILHPGWVRTDMGGPNALLSVEVSAAGLRRVMEEWKLEDSGSFINYDGARIPW